MILKSSLALILLISTANGCTDTDCDELESKTEWKLWDPKGSDRQQLIVPLPRIHMDGSISKILDRMKSERVQKRLNSNQGFEFIRNNAELSRTIQKLMQNVHRSQDYQPRSNRANSKENYHLQAAYIPRLG